MKEIKPRSAPAHQLALRNGAGAGIHKSKPRYEPTIQEYLDEMAEEEEANTKEMNSILADHEREQEG